MKVNLRNHSLSILSSKIEGLKIIDVKTAADERGTVRELYRKDSYSQFLPSTVSSWCQVNLTRTKMGAVRGLHGERMSKLVMVVHGSAFGVYVDTRLRSKTSGEVVSVNLVPGVQVFVPNGVCNGFQALEDTEYLYFFDDEWFPGMPGITVNPLDSELKIDWPIPIDLHNREQISDKDAHSKTFREIFDS